MLRQLVLFLGEEVVLEVELSILDLVCNELVFLGLNRKTAAVSSDAAGPTMPTNRFLIVNLVLLAHSRELQAERLW